VCVSGSEQAGASDSIDGRRVRRLVGHLRLASKSKSLGGVSFQLATISASLNLASWKLTPPDAIALR
jgi:hypothetical protein